MGNQKSKICSETWRKVMAEVGTKSVFPEFTSGTHLKDSLLIKIHFLGCLGFFS